MQQAESTRMWSIILRKDIMSYDVIPNSWIVTPEECAYPDVGLAKTKKMARECVQPGADWDYTPIEITKRDIGNFDRGLSDVIRMTLGKSTVTSSENEERGRGKRKKLKHRLSFDSESYNDNIDADSEEEQPGPSSITFHNGTPKENSVPEPLFLTPASKKQKVNSPRKVISSHSGCEFKGKKHKCCFKGNSTNLELLGNSMCFLSSEIRKITSNMTYLRECQDEIQKSIEVLMGRENSTRENDDLELVTEGVLEDFPITSLANLGSMEEKLRDKQFMLRCISWAASGADKTSDSRTVASIMARLITPEVAVNFTWKGIQRKDHRSEKKPFKDLAVAKVMIAATTRCWPNVELKKVYLTAATWLAQSQTKLNKMKRNAPTHEEEEELEDRI